MGRFVERDSVEALVSAQWIQVLGAAPESLDSDFFREGGTSLKAASMIAKLRRVFDREISLEVIFQNPSLRNLAHAIRNGTESGSARLVTLKGDGEGAPVIVVPNVFGSIIGLGGLSDSIFQRPVHALQSKGLSLEQGEPLSEISDIVRDFADVLSAQEISRRVHIAGFCMGGIFAHALACHLEERGWEVLGVMLLNTSFDLTPAPMGRLLAERVHQLADGAGLKLPDGEIPSFEELFSMLRESGMDILEENAAAFERRTLVFVANWHAAASYRPSVSNFPVTLFSAVDGDSGLSDSPVWRASLAPSLRTLAVPVGHFEMLYDQVTLESIESAFSADRGC
ncbi:phosphopantetheine-binding protein [Streptomyces parvulus]|uniref:thioesterase domain-containing protein n=1 Tax=Streptomyces parvulus TaxID=146923 RepID=UPI0038199070